MLFDSTIVLTLFVLFILFYAYLRWTYNGPPHVTGLPVVGYLPFLGKEPYLTFHKLMHKHGPIFSLYMGAHYTVILCNYDVVQEAFVEKGNVFNARPPGNIGKVYDYETAFPFVDGQVWKVTRNFTMNALKNLGFGTNFTKNFVQLEIQNLIRELKGHNGKPAEVRELLSKSTSMLLLSLLTGKRYDRTDGTGWVAQLIATSTAIIKTYMRDVTAMFPWLLKLPFVDTMGVRKSTRTLKNKIWSLLEEEMGSLRTTYSTASEPDNFIHSWYREQEKRNKNEDPHRDLFSDFSLKNNLDVLIEASTDTTSTTLHWAFLYLVLYPSVQEKIHQEIDEYIGSREPTLEDVRNLHYVRAFLMEVQRRGTVAPWGLFHSNKVKGYIRGFEIPRDSYLLCNLWSLNHDPKYFPDPYKFDPERFLDGERKFRPSEYTSAFSFGRRQCPGKQVAEIQLFLFLTSILQAFELRAPPGARPSDQEYEVSVIRWPVFDSFVFNDRHRQ